MKIKLFLFVTILFAKNNIYSQKIPYESEIIAFEKSDSIKMPPKRANLFVGSSSIKFWSAIKSDFTGYQVINRGFGGSNLEELAYFSDRIIPKYEPAKIFIYSGENDINAGATAKETFLRFQKVLIKIRNSLPNTPIVYISIKPSIARQSQFPVQKEANQLIKKYIRKQTKTKFVSMVKEMLVGKQPDSTLFIADKLHMNKKGYEIWTKKLKKYLVE